MLVDHLIVLFQMGLRLLTASFMSGFHGRRARLGCSCAESLRLAQISETVKT